MAEPRATPTDGETPLPAEDTETGDAERADGDRAPAAVAAPARDVPARTDAAPEPTTTSDEPTQQTIEPAGGDATAAAAPVEQPESIAAATEPVTPSKRSNRLFATGVVALAALLFEVVYLALVELFVLLFSGAAGEGQALTTLVGSGLIWVPLVVFVILYELLVLLLNRAGRFVYVVASLVVGLIVYAASIEWVVRTEPGTVFAQLLINPLFILAGLAAREVMLWTGFAVGAHGKRLRRKNKEARQEYEHERADAA